MKVIKNIKAFQEIAEYHRRTGKSIGFVPTMGFLHEGHVALILAAKDQCDIVAVSIYVNPTQFLAGEDFGKYPRDFIRDYHICRKSGVDYIFNPTTEEMYGEDYNTYIAVNDLSDKLEGKYRPGHFTGVATVVLKLFNIVKPHRIYFGQKDAQQAVIVRKMFSDLNADVEVEVCDTVREDDGLAMSSRNIYLSEEHRKEAPSIYEVLQEGKKLASEGRFEDAKDLKRHLRELLETKSPNCSLQYIAVTDNTELKKIDNLKKYKGDVLISLAVFYGNTRLIDNILFSKEK